MRAVALATAAAVCVAPAFEAVGRTAPGAGDVVAARLSTLLSTLTAPALDPPPRSPRAALGVALVGRRVAVLRAAAGTLGRGGARARAGAGGGEAAEPGPPAKKAAAPKKARAPRAKKAPADPAAPPKPRGRPRKQPPPPAAE